MVSPGTGPERRAAVGRALWLVLSGNLFVAAVKIVLGLVSGSASILSDGFHSVADASNNIVGLVGIHFASRPRDANHPYGHGKIETLTALFIGGMLITAAIEVVRHTLARIASGKPVVITPAGISILAATALINIVLYLYERSRGRRLNSEILIADSAHTATDIGITLAVVAGLFGVRGGWQWLDTAIALAVVFFIGRAAYQILLQAGLVLIDTQVLPVEQIGEAAARIEGVERSYHIRSRGRKSEVYVDLHISVNPDMTTEKAHQVATEVERVIRERLPGVVEVIVHVEPEPAIKQTLPKIADSSSSGGAT